MAELDKAFQNGDWKYKLKEMSLGCNYLFWSLLRKKDIIASNLITFYVPENTLDLKIFSHYYDIFHLSLLYTKFCRQLKIRI